MEKIIGLIIADDMEFLPFINLIKEIKAENKSEIYNNLKKSWKEDNLCECLIKAKSTDIRIIAICCGIGKVNAAMATCAVIMNCHADAIFNIGLSGGIHNVSRSDIILGKTYIEADFDLSPLGKKIGEKPGQEYIYKADGILMDKFKEIYPNIKSGNFGCGDFFLSDEKRKNLYKERFNLNAFDMETGAIAAVCYKYDVPFISMRKISDDASDGSASQYVGMNELAQQDLSSLLINAVKTF